MGECLPPDPLLAAAHPLVDQIGSLRDPDVGSIRENLRCAAAEDDDNGDASQLRNFVPWLWKLCRRERLRKTKSITFSIEVSIGGTNFLADLIRKEAGHEFEAVGNVSCIQEESRR